MKTSKIIYSSIFSSLVIISASPAYAAVGGPMPWGNFFLRVLNIIIVVGLIYYFAGAKIKGALLGRGKKVVTDMETLEGKKKAAIEALADVEKRIANVEAECEQLLLEGKKSAEQLAAVIVAEAEKQAKAIVDQANKSAEQAIRSEIAEIRAKVADEIMKEVRNSLGQNLDSKKHKDLIDASVARVSGF